MDMTELGKAIGRLEGAVGIHGTQLAELFEQTKEIRTCTDMNKVRAEQRDEALNDVRTEVREIKRLVSDGLTDKIANCERLIASMLECIDKRKREREAADSTGWRGSWNEAMARLRGNAIYLTIILAIGIVVWVTTWVMVKVNIFHEGPTTLLQWFGIGG